MAVTDRASTTFATSLHFEPTLVRGRPHNVTGNRLSDHDGALAVLRRTGNER
jgi:hypothetical protein